MGWFDRRPGGLVPTGGTTQTGTVLSLGQGFMRSTFTIPARTAALLYTEKGPAVSDDFGIRVKLDMLSGSVASMLFKTEPSTIYVDEPALLPKDPTSVPRPPYYPRYGALSPFQRGIYLNWLQDPAGPVDPGYAFLYYYGLERQLLLGDFQSAFEETVMLRQHHLNKSFQAYSMTALLTACVVRNRPDSATRLLSSLTEGEVNNVSLLVAARLGLSLPVGTVAGLALLMRDQVNVRYLKSSPSLYKEYLATVLTRRYGVQALPLGWLPPLADLPKRRQLSFANVSFPDDIRYPTLPSVTDCRTFQQSVSSLFDEVHVLVKERLTADRKATRASEKRHMLPEPKANPSTEDGCTNESDGTEP